MYAGSVCSGNELYKAVERVRERSKFLTDTRYGTRHHLARTSSQEKRSILCAWEATSMECKVRCPVVVWITVCSDVTSRLNAQQQIGGRFPVKTEDGRTKDPRSRGHVEGG